MGEKTKADPQTEFKFMDALHLAYIIFDSEKIYFFNKQAKKLLVLSAKHKSPLGLDALGFYDEEQKKQFKKTCSLILKSGGSGDLVFKRKGNKTKELAASISTVPYGKKKCLQALLRPNAPSHGSPDAEKTLSEIGGNSIDVIF